MLGNDFFNFWQIGHAVLLGLNPYSVPLSKYPPMTTMLFAIFALLPFRWAFPIWTGLNFVLLLDILRKRLNQSYLWILFSPVIFTLFTGQVDILFLWLACWGLQDGWPSIIFAALFTLKPQLAMVVLPWLIIRWIKQEPRSLLYWALMTLGLHILPLIYDPMIYSKWLAILGSVMNSRMVMSSGIFSLTTYQIPILPLLAAAFIIVIWGIWQNSGISQSTLLFTSPFTLWYDNILLIGKAPLWLMLPISWISFVLSYMVKNSVPLTTIPLVIILWYIWNRLRSKSNKNMDEPDFTPNMADQ